MTRENIENAFGAAFLFILCVMAILSLTGCGHNVGTAFNGKVFNVGYDPELNKFGVQYYDGVVVTGVQKENSESTLTFRDSVKAGDRETTSELVYAARNGEQITGYRVDLEKAKDAGNRP